MNKINELIEYLYVYQNIPFEKLDDKKTEKVNSEEFVCYHEIIHHINSLKNNPKENFKDLNNKILEYKNTRINVLMVFVILEKKLQLLKML